MEVRGDHLRVTMGHLRLTIGIAQCEGINQDGRLRDGNFMSFNLNINTKSENKSINICHLTRHLDCPSAPLGEVEPVRLDLFLGEDVGLDLVLVDPLGLVLGDLLEMWMVL